jgi:hypothetical protein
LNAATRVAAQTQPRAVANEPSFFREAKPASNAIPQSSRPSVPGSGVFTESLTVNVPELKRPYP